MRPRRCFRLVTACLLAALLLPALVAELHAAKGREQTRESLVRVVVPNDRVRVSDGDTMVISWDDGDQERVRVLGIDTPEVGHKDHFISEDQPYGPEARLFAEQRFAGAQKIELLRAAESDGYGRTLGYFFLDGENYSVQLLEARLAYETVQHYGDNGFPVEAAAILAAWESAKEEVEQRFEPPYKFRQKMRAKYEAEMESKGQKQEGKKDAAGGSQG